MQAGGVDGSSSAAAPHHNGKGWLEVWSCFPSVDHGQRWFVDHCSQDGKRTIADCSTAAEADAVATRTCLPVIYIQE